MTQEKQAGNPGLRIRCEPALLKQIDAECARQDPRPHRSAMARTLIQAGIKALRAQRRERVAT